MAKDKLDEALSRELSIAFEAAEAEDEPTEVEQEAPLDAEAPAAEPETTAPAAPEAEETAPEASRATATVKPTPAKVQPAPKPAVVEAVAPRTWGATAREDWAKLPRPVKDQILKREGEMARLIQESGEARREHARVQEALQPFVPHLKASGVDPVAAIGNLFRAEHTLRAGTPAQRAQLVAQMISDYGVDVEAIAATLEGKAPAAQASQSPPPFRDPRLDALLNRVQTQQQHQSAATRAQAAQELEAFRQGAEFFEDVRGKMGALMKAAREDGEAMTLQQAYDEACYLVPSVRTVMEKRKVADAARTLSQKAKQARYAGGSVQSEPSPPAGGRRPTMDEALWAKLNGQ